MKHNFRALIIWVSSLLYLIPTGCHTQFYFFAQNSVPKGKRKYCFYWIWSLSSFTYILLLNYSSFYGCSPLLVHPLNCEGHLIIIKYLETLINLAWWSSWYPLPPASPALQQAQHSLPDGKCWNSKSDLNQNWPGCNQDEERADMLN